MLAQSMAIRLEPVRACIAHVLINGGWTELAQGTGVVGSLGFFYTDGTSHVVDLITGQTIRETWVYKKDIFGAQAPQRLPGLNWHTVHTEPQERKEEAYGLLDLLSVDLDVTKQLRAVKIDSAHDQTSILISGITLSTEDRIADLRK